MKTIAQRWRPYAWKEWVFTCLLAGLLSIHWQRTHTGQQRSDSTQCAMTEYTEDSQRHVSMTSKVTALERRVLVWPSMSNILDKLDQIYPAGLEEYYNVIANQLWHDRAGSCTSLYFVCFPLNLFGWGNMGIIHKACNWISKLMIRRTLATCNHNSHIFSNNSYRDLTDAEALGFNWGIT